MGRAIPVVCAILSGIAGCEDAGPRPPSQVAVADSAGRLHVRLGRFADLAMSRWRVEERYDTGSGGARVELFRVTAARFLSDGSLAVANSGTQEIVFLAPDGGVRARTGGPGEGPGEFRHISMLKLDGTGNLVAYDPRLGRLTTLGSDGRVLGTRRFAPPSRVVDLHPLAFLDGQRILALYGESRIFAAGGERRDSTPLLVFDSASSVTDTLGIWPAQEWSYVSFPEGSSRTEVGFGRTLAYAGRNGYGVLGSTDSLDLTLFGPEGRAVMRVTGGGPNARVGAADIERWREDLLERRSSAPEFIKRALAEAPYRETFPAFSAVLIDGARRLWIGVSARPGEAQRKWIVIGPDGDLQGTLRLPADARVLDGAGDQLAVLRRNELDEEQIAVLHLVRPSG